MGGTKFFTPEEEDILIDLVSDYPPLFNLANKGFKDAELKSNIWRKIGVSMKKSDEACRNKWKTIRDYYIRKRREGKLTTAALCSSRKSDRFEKLRFLDLAMEKRETVSNVAPVNEAEVNSHSTFETEVIEELASLEEIGKLNNETLDSTCDGNQLSYDSDEPCCPPPNKKPTELPNKQKMCCKLLHLDYNQLSRERMHMIRDIAAKATKSNKMNDPIEDFFRGIISSVKSLPPQLQLQAKRGISNVVFDLEQQALSSRDTYFTAVPMLSPSVTNSPYISEFSSTEPPSPSTFATEDSKAFITLS